MDPGEDVSLKKETQHIRFVRQHSLLWAKLKTEIQQGRAIKLGTANLTEVSTSPSLAKDANLFGIPAHQHFRCEVNRSANKDMQLLKTTVSRIKTATSSCYFANHFLISRSVRGKR